MPAWYVRLIEGATPSVWRWVSLSVRRGLSLQGWVLGGDLPWVPRT